MSPTRLVLAMPITLLLAVACDDKAAAVADALPSGAESGNAEAKDEAEAKAEAPAEAEPAKEAEAETAEPAEAAADPTDEKAGAADTAPAPAKTDPAKPEVAAKTDPSTAKTAETIPLPPATEKDKPPADKKKPGAIVAGQRATAVASVKAEEGYKCNDEFPHKFTAKGGNNVDYPSDKVSGSCAGTKSISVSVPYTPKAAGPGTVSGELKYGICDDAKTNCRIMKKAVTLSFNAEAN